MDYDRTEIADFYDKARALLPETARLWLNLLSIHISRTATPSLVIDLGCGTGRFSDLIATGFGVEVIGIDPSQKMIDQARRKHPKGKVSYRRGAAEALPFADSCADLIFMSNIYHHLSNPAAVAAECHRVLQPSGHVCVRNGTQEDDFPHRHFFPGLEALIGSQLPSQDDIRRVFVASGFVPVIHQKVIQVIAPNWSSFVEKSGLRADSFLARLTDEDFEKGMAALQFPGDGVDLGTPVSEEIDWFVFTRNG